MTLEIENISAEPAIGNELNIHLRITSADNPAASVSILQGSPSKLLIDTHSIANFTIVLESYDNNSSVKSTLKTDLIDIFVMPCQASQTAIKSLQSKFDLEPLKISI